MQHWQEMQSYVGFTAEDAARLAALLPYAEPRLPELAERFYAAILRFPDARAVLRDEATVLRLKGTLQRWIRELLTGPHDEAYWERRLAIGRTHVRVGLPERYMFTAMNLLREDLVAVASQELPAADAWATCHALARITDIELGVMCSTYMEVHEDQRLRSLQELIVQSLPITVLCLNAAGQVTAATRPSVRLFDSLGRLGDGYEAFLPPDLVQTARLPYHLRRALDTGYVVSIPQVVLGDGAHARTFRVTVVPLRHELAELILNIEELTDAVQAEARAQQAEALARIGSLAANMAHEIRNPLTAISATLQVITGTLDEGDRRRVILAKVQEQVLRLDRLVSDLLGYARPAQPRMARVELGALAREAATAAGVSIELLPHPEAEAWADPFQVQQVLLNLLQNAADAAGPGGTIQLTVGPGPRLVVNDSGPGVPAELRERVFEAFVTTKTRGTGLGLAICRKVVDAMSGSLVLLQPGEAPLGGAAFVLTLQAPPDRASPSGSAGYSG